MRFVQLLQAGALHLSPQVPHTPFRSRVCLMHLCLNFVDGALFVGRAFPREHSTCKPVQSKSRVQLLLVSVIITSPCARSDAWHHDFFFGRPASNLSICLVKSVQTGKKPTTRGQNGRGRLCCKSHGLGIEVLGGNASGQGSYEDRM